MKIDGRVAIVTGAASGLGAATARRLASGGARVALLDIDSAAGEKLAGEIGGVFFSCDVSSSQSGGEAISAIVRNLGAPSILVSCAGVGTAGRIVGRDGALPLEEFERVVRINLVGSFNMMRLAGEAMQSGEADSDGQRGVIISTASIAAYDGQIGQAAYAASKGGIVSLTLPAAREFSRFGVRCMTIAPGLFHTPLLQSLPEEIRSALGSAIPNPARLGTPEEFAALVVAIVENNYLNGETIRLDGALRLPPK